MLLSELLDEARGGTRTLYYIGRRPAQPKPKRVGHWKDRGQPEPAWVRPWLDAPVQKAVFLTTTPDEVAHHHGVFGHVYAYSVPQWVIKQAGGLHRFDWATEIVIPDVLWKHVKFLGKSADAKEFDTHLKRRDNESAWKRHNLNFAQKRKRERKK